jgi:hypothetical protein
MLANAIACIENLSSADLLRELERSALLVDVRHKDDRRALGAISSARLSRNAGGLSYAPTLPVLITERTSIPIRQLILYCL